MHKSTSKWVWLAVACLFVCGGALADEEIPTWKTYNFSFYMPKLGQLSPGSAFAGPMRNTFETTYEGWWREASYYKANLTNGATIRGVFMDTKTMGEVALPWTVGTPNATATNVTQVVGQAQPGVREYSGGLALQPDQNNNVTFTIDTQVLTADGTLDSFGRGILSGDGSGTINYDTGAFFFSLSNAPTQVADIEANYISVITSAGGSPIDWVDWTTGNGPPMASHPIPDGRGENNREDLGQRHGGTGPLVDNYWTPGERFVDEARGMTPPNGTWDDVVYDEDFWNSDNVNLTINGNRSNEWGELQSLVARRLYQNQETTTGDDEWDVWRGEYYADYNHNTPFEGTRATDVKFETNVEIWVANPLLGYNEAYVVTEHDVSVPDPNAGTNYWEGEGDHNHYAVTSAPPGSVNSPRAVDVPRNGLFDYNTHQGGNPIVGMAFGNGVGGFTNQVFVLYNAYVKTPHIWDSGIAPIPWTNATPPTVDQATFQTVTVIVYQAGEIWGQENVQDPVERRIEYVDWLLDGGFYLDDAQWTEGFEAEPFEDFVSWWRPLGGPEGNGAWVNSVVGSPAGTLGPVPGHAGEAITYTEYTTYVTDNYPGSVAGLIARCGNEQYDGPDEWDNRQNKKMQWSGFDPSTVNPAPGTYGDSGWDSYGIYGGWSAWWVNDPGSYQGFAAYSASAPAWDGRLPVVDEFSHQSMANTSTITTQLVGGASLVVTNWNDRLIPPNNDTWDYDAPREFSDLGSSMYHVLGTGGDSRLGEEMCIGTFSILGEDIGDNVAATRNTTLDMAVPAAGPLAYNVDGYHGLDGASLAYMEMLTWRTDGNSLTGPRSVHPASGELPVMYGRDHRDVNLNGLIDQGECVVARSFNYMIDPDELTPTPNNGMDTWPLWGWERCMEDLVEAVDRAEDYRAVMLNNSTSGTEIVLAQPSSPVLADGDAAFGTLGNVRYRQNTPPVHTGFDPTIDDAWVDENSDGLFTVETIVNDVTGTLVDGTPASATLATCWYIDMFNDGFTVASDLIWHDTVVNGVIDSDLALCDPLRVLDNGDVGQVNNLLEPLIAVFYQDANGNNVPDSNDNFWLENQPGCANPNAQTYDVNLSLTVTNDIILYVGSPIIFTNGVPADVDTRDGVRNIVGRIYYDHVGPGADPGYWTPGNNLWYEYYGGAGTFDSETIISAPYGVAINHPPMTHTALGTVGYVDNDASGGYDRVNDDAWAETFLNATYDTETILVGNRPLVNGTPGTLLGLVVYKDNTTVDADGNPVPPDGQYTPIYAYGNGEDIAYYGDSVWVDGNGNNAFDQSRIYSIPIYGVGLYNSAGASAPAVFHSGNFFSSWTRDGVNFGGWNQVQPALNLPLLTHEQCHDVLGWPDLYDYDIDDPNNWQNTPIANTDLMDSGGLVHSYPDLKGVFPGMQFKNLKTIIGSANTGVHTIRLYPVEHVPDQYYYFMNPAGTEYFWFHYQSGGSVYSDPLAQGIAIGHTDNGTANGGPIQQRNNYRAIWKVVQADSQYSLEDATAMADNSDAWPGTTGQRVFSEGTHPEARWFNQEDAGIRVVDIRIPEGDPWQPAEVDFEWVTTDGEWIWTEQGADIDGDGIPDVWEYYWFSEDGIVINPLDTADRTSDWDGDGLSDYYEWRSRLNPKSWQSWNVGPDGSTLSDAEVDLDGDGLSGLDEQNLGTDPWLIDTDDDGLTDREESNQITDPNSSTSPFVMRYLRADGSGYVGVAAHVPGYDPAGQRFSLKNWTVEAATRLIQMPTAEVILVGRYAGFGSYATFELGVKTDMRPFVRYENNVGSTYEVVGDTVLDLNTWYMLGGRLSSDEVPGHTQLSLFVNYEENARQVTDTFPALLDQQGELVMAVNLIGDIDEVRIWDHGRTDEEIQSLTWQTMVFNTNLALVPVTVTTYVTNTVAPLNVTTNTIITGTGETNRLGMVGYWPMDDGRWTNGVDQYTEAVEDFAHRGLMSFAGTLRPAAANIDFVPLDNPYTNTAAMSYPKFYPVIEDTPWTIDSDGDAMPDIFERYFNLDPTLKADAWYDTDGDGLANIYEYFAATDPRTADSDGNGFGDYDSYAAGTFPTSGDILTHGQKFDDGDRIPDAWELRYPGPAPETGKRGLDYAYYDADLDPDEDGWSNLSEYLGSELTAGGLVRSSNPLSSTNFPWPMVFVRARYFGDLGNTLTEAAAGASVPVDGRATRRVDGPPLATLDFTGNTWSNRQLTTGHLVEGPMYAYAFLDLDGSQTWDPGEPAAVPKEHPIQVGWDEVNEIEFGLTDALPNLPRVSWAPIGNKYRVDLVINSVTNFTRVVRNRNYLHEWDYMAALNNGLTPDTANMYTWIVSTNANIFGMDYFFFSELLATFVTNNTLARPTFVTPHDTTFRYARNEIEWRMERAAVWYEIEIYSNTNAAPLLVATNRAPYRDRYGVYKDYLPFFANDQYLSGQAWDNGRYYMRIRANVGANWTSWSSPWRAFNLDLKEPLEGGKSMITGDIHYFGKVTHGVTSTNLDIIVQAFTSKGFSGDPDGQIQLSIPDVASNMSFRVQEAYEMMGLHRQRYYVRAFIDVDGDHELDGWEPWGYAHEIDNDYEPVLVDLSGESFQKVTDIDVVIRDRDTDDDQLPDGWEWMYFGSLDYGGYDIAANTLTLFQNYTIGVHGLDPTINDQDGDGLLDIDELLYGTPGNTNHYDPISWVYNPTGTDLNMLLVDSDGDGVDDFTEFNTPGLDPAAYEWDSDGDGMSNADEIIAGTDPLNPLDFLWVTPTNIYVLEWTGVVSRTYRVQLNDNIVTDPWVTQTNIWTGVGPHTYIDPDPAPPPTRYYRITVQP